MTIDSCRVLEIAKVVMQKGKIESRRRSDMFITMIIKVIKILLEHCLFLLITWYKTY